MAFWQKPFACLDPGACIGWWGPCFTGSLAGVQGSPMLSHARRAEVLGPEGPKFEPLFGGRSINAFGGGAPSEGTVDEFWGLCAESYHHVDASVTVC